MVGIGFDFVGKVRFLVKCLSETELASFCEAKSFQTGIFILETGLIEIIFWKQLLMLKKPICFRIFKPNHLFTIREGAALDN